MLAEPAVADLATFTGRPVGSFGPYATQALSQATLLFSLITKRTEYPDTAQLEQLARNAIMQMADRLLLEQPHAMVKANPFSSESIGSYSYSKSLVWQKAKDGGDTGLMWWEFAIDELTLAGRSLVSTGAIRVVDNGYYTSDAGEPLIYGPAELYGGPFIPGVDG
jgi:hypothetical protein